MGVAALWVVAAALDEELVYEITAGALAARDAGELWTPATRKGAGDHASPDALRGVAVPLHPGAARYYREHGLAE